ncbi:MAG: NHL repeat-containing protein [Armatimonadota bacterium]
MPSRSMLLSKLLLSAITVAVLGSSVTGGEVYKPKVLFSMKYGTGVMQLPKGVNNEHEGDWLWQSSISKLLVPSEDQIIIGKYGDARVIVLNRHGTLQRAIMSHQATHNAKEQARVAIGNREITDIAAVPKGKLLLAVNDPKQSVWVYSADGKYDKQGWNTIYSQITQKVKLPSSQNSWRSIRADAAGNYYISVLPDKTNYSAMAKFDAKLKFLGLMPGRGGFAGWNGNTYESVRNAATKQFNGLRMFSSKGKVVRTIKLVPPKSISKSESDFATNIWDMSTKAVDSSGDIYLIALHARPKGQWIRLDRGFNIENDVTIYKFDANGKFVTKLKVQGLPCPAKSPVAVDPAGNIYHLAYYKDRIDMVKYTPRK